MDSLTLHPQPHLRSLPLTTLSSPSMFSIYVIFPIHSLHLCATPPPLFSYLCLLGPAPSVLTSDGLPSTSSPVPFTLLVTSLPCLAYSHLFHHVHAFSICTYTLLSLFINTARSIHTPPSVYMGTPPLHPRRRPSLFSIRTICTHTNRPPPPTIPSPRHSIIGHRPQL